MIPESNVIRVSRQVDRCRVLGPGIRTVLWVQGCPLRCPGCTTPEALAFEGGSDIGVENLAQAIAAIPDVDGVTYSGGEPTSQAYGLTQLTRRLRQLRPEFGFMSYTGFVFEEIVARGNTQEIEFLRELDLLVDGPYIAARHTDLRWRGSDNQRVLFLSEKYRSSEQAILDRGVWMEFSNSASSLEFSGIPPRGFLRKFERAMSRQGVHVSTQEIDS